MTFSYGLSGARATSILINWAQNVAGAYQKGMTMPEQHSSRPLICLLRGPLSLAPRSNLRLTALFHRVEAMVGAPCEHSNVRQEAEFAMDLHATLSLEDWEAIANGEGAKVESKDFFRDFFAAPPGDFRYEHSVRLRATLFTERGFLLYAFGYDSTLPGAVGGRLNKIHYAPLHQAAVAALTDAEQGAYEVYSTYRIQSEWRLNNLVLSRLNDSVRGHEQKKEWIAAETVARLVCTLTKKPHLSDYQDPESLLQLARVLVGGGDPKRREEARHIVEMIPIPRIALKAATKDFRSRVFEMRALVRQQGS